MGTHKYLHVRVLVNSAGIVISGLEEVGGVDQIVDSSISNSIIDSNVRSANLLHLKNSMHTTSKIWSLGKSLALSFYGCEEVLITKIAELEERDRSEFTQSDLRDVEETKLEVCDDSLCFGLWGNKNCDWEFSPSSGRSGGILSLWDSNKFQKISVYRGVGFLAVYGTWLSTQLEVPQKERELKEFSLQEKLTSLMSGLERWNSSQWALIREFSDHCPVVLRYKKIGQRAFVLKEKLKILKEAIKAWNKKIFCCIDTTLSVLSRDIQALDLIGETISLDDVQVVEKKNLTAEWWKTANWRDNLLRQKSRNKWLKEGDANTSFFYACINNRRRRNQIHGVWINGLWCEEEDHIRSGASNYFKKLFTQVHSPKPILAGVVFSMISDSQRTSLDLPFSEEEVKLAVWSCDGDKSPSPDGFNFKIFQTFWDTIKKDIILFVGEFQRSGKLSRGLNASFIALIPKINCPTKFQDFRPISLIGSLYKTLAKIMGSRLKGVMGSIISSSQSAFIQDKYILDATVVVNETINSTMRNKDGCLLLNVDFEKAYDSVDWGFLNYMLSRFGFSDKWRRLINACLCSTSMSVLVNEGFAGLVRNARRLGMLGYKIGRQEVEVCDLQFADYTILVCKPTVSNLWCIKFILKCFELASGMKVNYQKSSLYGIEVSESFLADGMFFLACRTGTLPFLYLGVPVGANPRRLETWQNTIDVVTKRLVLWKHKHISLGGRVILLNSVLANIPTYLLSLYKAPKKRLGSFNDALLGKWKCRRLQDKEALWVKVVNSKYGNTIYFSSSANSSRWWKDLCKVDSSVGFMGGWFDEKIWRVIGDGSQTRFWLDIWVGNHSLKEVFPRLFTLALNREAFVADCGDWCDDVWKWEVVWRRDLLDREKNIIENLYALIQNHSCKRAIADSWGWSLDASGRYTIKSAYLSQVDQSTSPLSNLLKNC
ncbi:PREDICTED: uncharacterized protein LOC109359661 [Lupinus angustifolius]|uniref:uncharacterized protein LOC109359661 n=1 Tax=Lupinus angustifolius TaxID=3871 RepID=UPI00092E6674|nr:PREDICTED: uncharacterized protein LOC109359661 [Lupinus angustifolius]